MSDGAHARAETVSAHEAFQMKGGKRRRHKRQGSTKDQLKFIAGYWKQEKWMLLSGFIFLLLGQASDFIAPLYMGFAIDKIEQAKFDEIGPLCLQLFAIVVVSGIFQGLRAQNFHQMSEEIATKLRLDLYSSILNKDIEFFENNRTGDLLSRLNSDTTTIQDNMTT